ncbi:serine/threonine protein kinase [Glycomyces tenuis]|uniref:serine/threonine protein kinase n=1 Tax=Glycomyces tenuis TaxID=58116 RepID=UPI0003FAD6FD|nr:serine/threonine protein kinase [Glycomyces tenuis]
MESGIRIANRYVLEELIATGGMGAVWRGHDAQLDRPVAVKLLRNSLFQDNDEARKRFDREARAAARLKGAGFAVVYDHGSCTVGDEDVAYLVMELVEGESLSALLDREERLSPERAMAVIGAVADTLRLVHREGIVHRDIKPGNILIEEDGAVKLVDFGIARINGVTSLTSTGVALGTLHYASPEQLDLKDTTAVSDLYSLGAVAYECLAGEPPFASNDRTAVVAAHLNAAPPPLPDEVPPRVAAVVMKALAKAPEDRWASAEAFAEACRAAAGEATVPLAMQRQTVQQPNGAKPSGPRRLGFVAAAVAVILLLAGLLAWSPWTGPADDGPTAAGDEDTSESVQEGDSQSGTGAVPGGGTGTPSEASSPDASSGTDPAPDADGGESGGDTTGGTGGDTGGDGSGGGESGGEDTDPGGGEDTDPGGDTADGGGEQVPDLYGVPVAEAQAQLHALGFDSVETQQHMSKEGDGSLDGCDVVMQDPGAGTTADHDDTITLTYYAFATHLCW